MFQQGCRNHSANRWRRCIGKRNRYILNIGVQSRMLMEGDWPKYEEFPRFVLSMGSFFPSNSVVEKTFSVETDIHRDPRKNLMSQDILDAHMQIRFGVESELSFDRNSCDQCNSTRKRPHCHCSKAVINEEMRNRFKEAYKVTPGEEKDEAAVDD